MIGPTVCSALNGKIALKHPELGVLVREDGMVFIPESGPNKPHWTFGSKNNKGYLRVQFRGKNYQVHRLVAETYVPNPNPKGYKEVDHYPDRNPLNNRADNLRWADRKIQNNNRQICEDSKARYGVRYCEDPAGYMRARYANNPDEAERCRASAREWRAKNTERKRSQNREYRAKQKALGKKYRKCPDGSRRYLTDEEFDRLYSKETP